MFAGIFWSMYLFCKDNVDLDKNAWTHKLFSVFTALIFNKGIFTRFVTRFYVNLDDDKDSVKP